MNAFFFLINEIAILQRCEPQQILKEISLLLRPNIFFFMTRFRDTSFDV